MLVHMYMPEAVLSQNRSVAGMQPITRLHASIQIFYLTVFQ